MASTSKFSLVARLATLRSAKNFIGKNISRLVIGYIEVSNGLKSVFIAQCNRRGPQSSLVRDRSRPYVKILVFRCRYVSGSVYGTRKLVYYSF